MQCLNPFWNNRLTNCVGWDVSHVVLPQIVLGLSASPGTYDLDLASLHQYTLGWTGLTNKAFIAKEDEQFYCDGNARFGCGGN